MNLTRGGPPKAKTRKDADTIELITIPKRSSRVSRRPTTTRSRRRSTSPHPQIADVPQVITDTSFVQPLQPPPPDNIKIAKGARSW